MVVVVAAAVETTPAATTSISTARGCGVSYGH
jgi:hypothetical protein